MLNIPGYQIIDLIYQSQKIVVYRGHRTQDQSPVILKTLKIDYPTLADIAKLKHEYEITKNLDLVGIVKPYSLETYQNIPLLILEYFGGKVLAELIASSKITLQTCLNIAIKLTTTIGNLHNKQIIHKDIKPQNLLINTETGQVKISNFSISSLLSKEAQTISSPKLLESTLAYMSPELTGRMNRTIDYRTDFYSLGVTLYEMMTGQLPFQATDPMELVHCHIAKQPIPPHLVNSEIPASVSALVMKLLSKTAEDRYQNAYGIKADLEACLFQLLNTGKIEYFTLGQQDLSGRFEIPQKLYGRESQVATIMDAFNRVSQGPIEMLLIAGYSGIGKSALVNEIHKPVVRARGYFISGKFDQYKRNIPYSSLIQAFRDLMRQLLTESEAQIQTWKQKVLAALGPNGQVIIDVIPEVELIVGPQPPIVQLGPAESQNRFNLVLKNFIHVFAQKEHPLVMFLDDLQWADSASLKLIQVLMTDPDGQYLLMIGAYRDNEVSSTHPLILTLDEIQQAGATVNTLTLQPLAITHINQLIADTIKSPLTKVQPLAELMLDKTDGNPFFLTQLLKYLNLERFLLFNFSTREWQWDIKLIQSIGITDNVVELMVCKIQELSDSTQNVLKMAACIGNRFDLDVLSIVNEKSRSATAAELWEALQAGLIIPLSNAYKIPQLLEQFDELVVEYKFLHDRVQQGAYALIPDDQKKEVHLKVGQLLLQNTNLAEQEEKIFDIVNHLNISAELTTTESERYELAKLNLMAGQKAKAAMAYEAALKYLTFGLGLLAENSWQRQYSLSLILHIEAVEVEYLNTCFERAQRLSEVVFLQATSLLDQVKVYELKIQFYIAENQMIEAINTALPVLELLGYPLPQTSSDLSLMAELPKLSDLEDIPEMTDPAQLAALQILTIITGPAYMAKPEILPVIVFKMVNLCLEYGHSALAAYAYGMYALLLCGSLGDIETGYHSGQLSLHLLDQFDAKELKCKIYMLFNSFVRHWKEHGKETISSFVETIQTGFETGDIVYATYCCMWSCSYLFLIGEPLDSLEQKQRQYINLLEQLKQEYGWYPAKTWRQMTLNLQNLGFDKFELFGESFDQADMQHLRNINNRLLLFFVYLAKMILAYLFKDNVAAVTNAKIAAEYEDAATASMLISTYKLYNSLAQLGMYPTAAPSEQIQYLKQVELNQQKMKQWAYQAPMNCQHKYELVEAEKARVLGQIVEAMELYDRAIQGAREQRYLQDEALAYERAAEFYFSIGREEIAQLYMTKAHYGYFRWGATAKVKDLESEYPHFLVGATNRTGVKGISTIDSTTGSDPEVLDLTTVIKASQALAGEIVLDKLLKKLMRIVIENAGAQKGFLILDKEGKWVIEAEGAVDSDDVTILQSIPVSSVDADRLLPLLSTAIINYVARSQENVVLNDAAHAGQFTRDPYIVATQPKSILCTPLLHQGKLSGILYLENNLTTGAFTPDRLEVLKLLSSQAAISIENAKLYEEMTALNRNLKQEVSDRQRAEEALRESERRLAQFLEAVPVGVFVIDTNGKPYYANQTAQQILGKAIVPEATPAQLTEIYQAYVAGTEQLYPTEQQPIVQALNGKSTTIDDMELHQADKIIPLEVSATPIFDEKGQIVYTIAAFQDITQRKRAEAERIQFTQELALKNAALQQAKEALAEYNRTLEQKVEERTQELSQTLLILKATQAELVFENALLRSAEPPSIYDYQIGGSLPMDAPTYVVRSADRHLYKVLKLGEFCYILNARQMGKSSLMVRMIYHLQQEGFSCAAIDMTRIGSENITPDQWYKGLAVELWQSFDLLEKVNLKAWWNERLDISPVQRLGRFIEEVLLVEVGVENKATPKNLVIFLDEIDSVLGLTFPVNDFFTLIRFCYNQRSINPKYQRLTFALFGVATPSDLITDTQRTPFNIGQAIQLRGFKEHEAQPLLQGLTEKVSNPQVVLKEVLGWTNGQPFLTQKLCKLIRSSSSPIPTNGEAEWIENLVRTNVIDNWESQDEPEHLRTVRDRILKSERQPVRLLEFYRQILHRGQVVAVDSPESRELLLSGLVVKQHGSLRVHNRIYELIFDSSWIELHV